MQIDTVSVVRGEWKECSSSLDLCKTYSYRVPLPKDVIHKSSKGNGQQIITSFYFILASKWLLLQIFCQCVGGKLLLIFEVFCGAFCLLRFIGNLAHSRDTIEQLLSNCKMHEEYILIH